MKLLGDGAIPINSGLYPWSWARSDEIGFNALKGGLLVAPILRELILNREPKRVLDWADKIKLWPITRIIPSHYDNNIRSNGKEFRRAFSFLEDSNAKGPKPNKDDLFLLSTLSDVFTKLGVVAPSQSL
jgi:hypothetical protein